MKLSTSVCAFGAMGNNPLELVQVCQKTRFKHLDFTFRNYLESDDYIEKYKEAKKLADDLGIDFPMIHAPYAYNPCADQESFDIQVEQMRRAFEVCSVLGVDRITVHSGFGFSETKEEMFEKNIQYYKKILPFAEDNGVMIMIENIAEEIYKRKFVVETAEDILFLKNALNGHPLINACWDTGHANTKALDQYDNIKKLGGILKGLHLQDNNGYNDDHMPLLLGTVNFDEVVQGLLDINYDGPFNLECHFINPGKSWPNYRRDFTEQSNAKPLVFDPDEELRFYSIDLIYHMAEYVMNKYNIEVE